MSETESYYDDGRITFPEAESVVEEFVTEASEAETATSKEVAEFFDIEDSTHNLVRIHDALDERCAVLSEGSRKRFQLPDGGYIEVGDHV